MSAVATEGAALARANVRWRTDLAPMLP